jgi:hypothetical protein
LTAGCCSDVDHIPNRQQEDFAKTMEQNVYAARTNIKDFAFRHGLRKCIMVSAWSKIKKMEQLWADPVNLSAAAYEELATTVLPPLEALRTRGRGAT